MEWTKLKGKISHEQEQLLGFLALKYNKYLISPN